MDDDRLQKEDWAEPRCLLCDAPYGAKPQPRFIPRQRVTEKYDALIHRNDYAAAERHMRYWLEEAQLGSDLQGQFQIRNELMGLYRKTGRQQEAFNSAEAALSLLREMHAEQTADAATAYLNAATVYDAFDMPEESLPLFSRAQEIYTRLLPPDDARFGGLFNNMGLAYCALRRFDEANDCYRRALDVMEHIENGQAEQAVTHLNMADAVYAQYGDPAENEIDEHLETALRLLEDPTLPQNGNYAFVCEKCASTFAFYGWADYARELEERARKIYAGT